jgi:hypothetical protein
MRTLTVLTAVLLLSSCDLAGKVSEYQANAEAAAIELEKQLGSKPDVNWSAADGRLVNVNVMFDGRTVSSLTVKDLENRSRTVLATNFKETPQQLIVSIRWMRDDATQH